MAILYLDNGGIAAAGDYSVDVPFMGTINNNDLLIVQLLDADNDSFSPPSGDWNLIYQEGANSNASHAYYWYRANGTETGVATFTSALNAGAGVYGVMARFSGCITDATPVEGINGVAVSQTTTPTIPAVTIAGTGRLVLGFVTVEDNIAVTGNNNFTEAYQETSTFGGDANLTLWTQDADSSTSSEQLSCGNEYIGILGVALIPATAGSALTKDLFDTVTFSEEVVVVTNFNRSLSDTITFSEDINTELIEPPSLLERTKGLSFAHNGQPWCKVVAKSGLDPNTMDYSHWGEPWWGLSETVLSWTAYELKYHNGSDWVTKPLKYYDGSWITKDLKVLL